MAEILDKLLKMVKSGIATKELDRAAEALILDSGAKVAFKGYEGFPGAMCTSVNEEVVHTVPSEKVLQEGDILTLDIGLLWKGFYLDMARTFPVGKIAPEAARLIHVTREALQVGLRETRVGAMLGDIGNAIQRYVESQGYQVVRELSGHGIGRELHEEPHVLNYGKQGTGPELVEGMVICIEPMVTVGDWKLKRSKDGFGYETQDGSLSCHFEDTVALTKQGPLVLTR